MVTLLPQNLFNLKEFHHSVSSYPEKNKIKYPNLTVEASVMAEASVKELDAIIK